MDIKTQCCGIAMLLVITYFYNRHKRINLNTERAFIMSMRVSFLCVLFDIASIVVIDYMDMLPKLLVDLVCKTYLASLINVGVCALLYVLVDIYDKTEKYYMFRKWTLLASGLGTLIIYLLPIGYFEEGGKIIYTYGPSVLTTYILTVPFIIVTFVLMHAFKGSMNPKRRTAVQMWMFIWLGSAVVQFLRNDWLIVGFSIALGMVIIFISLENPETNLDRNTGIFNQNALFQYADQLYDMKKNFALLSVIMEYSWQINMKKEHEDEVNMEIVKFFSEIKDTMIFKNSEDEIVLLFLDGRYAEIEIQKIQKRFERSWGSQSVYIQPTCIFVPDADVANCAEELLAFLRSTRHNRNRFVKGELYYIDENTVNEMYEEKRIEQLIVEAIDCDRVEVFYQPIYSTKEHKFVSAEALVRIRDDEGKIVPPGLFIEIAEQNGMIIQLGEIVFEKVCRFLKEKDLEQYGIHYIEVNLSVVQCANENLAERFMQIMKKYDVAPHLINLEITESASLHEKKVLLRNMEILTNYGVSFSLDDFGTGQSNLNYIVDMPVDIVKFDRDMSNAYFVDEKARYVMDAAMHMIHGMKLEIVSEGIETEEQYKVMDDLGISYIQGYYFSKPLEMQEFLKFIKASLDAA